MKTSRTMVVLAIPPAILFLLVAGLRLGAEALRIPAVIPKLFSVSVAVVLSSIYVGLIAHRRGLDRTWGVIPTMLIIGLLAQVAIVTVDGMLASLLGVPGHFNAANETLDWRHVFIHLGVFSLLSGLLLSIPAAVIYTVIRRSDREASAPAKPHRRKVSRAR